jgi:hypothetical protein
MAEKMKVEKPLKFLRDHWAIIGSICTAVFFAGVSTNQTRVNTQQLLKAEERFEQCSEDVRNAKLEVEVMKTKVDLAKEQVGELKRTCDSV